MKIIVSFIFFGYLSVYHKFVFADNSVEEEDFMIYQRYIELDKNLKKYVAQGMKYLIPYFIEVNENVNVSTNCMKNIFKLSKGIRNLKLWALQFPDASGKVQDGILSRNTLMLGDYEQCIKAKALKRDGGLDFRGQYCVLGYRPILPKRKGKNSSSNGYDEFVHMTKNSSDLLHLLAEAAPLMETAFSFYGLCVPSGCNIQDINETANYIGKKYMTYIDVLSCQVEGSLPVLDKRNIIIICIFAVFTLIGVIATILDYYLIKSGSDHINMLQKILLCFSIIRNFQKLMNTEFQDGTLTCLHGIRVLTLFWIILCHQFILSGIINFYRNFGRDIEDYVQAFFSQIIVNPYFAVDMFFLMGGLVHSYVRIRKENAENKKNGLTFITLIILRIWRLAPSYVFAILTMFLLVQRGPLSLLVHDIVVERCEKYWWRNALFIQNLFNLENMCLPHAWYVAVDMQLFVISLIPVALLVRNPKKGLIVNGSLVITGIAVSIIWSYLKNISPTSLLFDSSIKGLLSFFKAYVLPVSHVSPYFAGVIIGSILARKETITLKPIYQFIGWITSSTCFITLLFVSQKWNSGAPYYRMESALYFSIAKLVQSLAVGWIIFCCSTGNGGIINYILSLKLWVPISRISYTMYLVSFVVQVYFFANLKHPIYFNDILWIWRHFGDIAISGLLSLAIALLFDSPFIALLKLIMQKKLKSTELTKTHEEHVVTCVVKTEMNAHQVLQKDEEMVSKL